MGMGGGGNTERSDQTKSSQKAYSVKRAGGKPVGGNSQRNMEKFCGSASSGWPETPR